MFVSKEGVKTWGVFIPVHIKWKITALTYIESYLSISYMHDRVFFFLFVPFLLYWLVGYLQECNLRVYFDRYACPWTSPRCLRAIVDIFVDY